MMRGRGREVQNQIVTDDQGRRRFHGAFTGGFSAGYYNSVGSEEGWTPSEYKSGRRRQRPEDFMDEEDDQLMGRRMVTQDGYSRNQTKSAENVILRRHDQIGKRLLMQLGWRPGHGVGPKTRRGKHLYKETNHLFAPKDVSIYIASPKNDVYGLGFSEKDRLGSFSSKRTRTTNSRLVMSAGNIGTLTSAFDARDQIDDIYGDDEDMSNYNRAIDVIPFADRETSHALLLQSKSHPQERTSDGKPVRSHDSSSEALLECVNHPTHQCITKKTKKNSHVTRTLVLKHTSDLRYRKDGCCNVKDTTHFAKHFQIFKYPDILTVIIVFPERTRLITPSKWDRP